ncbi:5'/3'-nucleotidase SurE [Aquabacter spiritensis]|uniref:5'-nucleotidase SurE n=1 Tax=Aquabacter spiritensis TaxID=933073 RepID=A0A4R3LRZ2_9HYPH|nr:5'/3'-nucleotidase SurE [Aquabacter spiritensis]TCT03272.1 5'-nucleotidase /3'-nucleotidase /exopolyphosphatase [Aquabacter spiritensis]
MRILVTNDDGIHSPGLDACIRIAEALSDDVWVVAPEFDQSGVAHSLSLSDPLRLREIAPRRFAVKGTPTDCVIMAVRHILDAPPDLILSGVNRGQNIAEDVSYSGTVAGAIEGTILGIPSVALSQAFGPTTREAPSYDTAETYGPDVVRTLLKEGVPKGIVINVNFPDRPPQEVAGIAVTAQGKRDQNLMRIEARRDGRNNPYFWIAFERRISATVPGSDLRALDEGRISVTPLRVDQTDEPFMTRLVQVFEEAAKA